MFPIVSPAAVAMAGFGNCHRLLEGERLSPLIAYSDQVLRLIGQKAVSVVDLRSDP